MLLEKYYQMHPYLPMSPRTSCSSWSTSAKEPVQLRHVFAFEASRTSNVRVYNKTLNAKDTKFSSISPQINKVQSQYFSTGLWKLSSLRDLTKALKQTSSKYVLIKL